MKPESILICTWGDQGASGIDQNGIVHHTEAIPPKGSIYLKFSLLIPTLILTIIYALIPTLIPNLFPILIPISYLNSHFL